MKVRRLIDEGIGDFDILLEAIESEPGIHDYGIPTSAWRRAVKFMAHYGVDRALSVIDERAERAGDRRNFGAARRWRNLITAIHAMTEEEHLPGEKTH